jgi:catechol O-methyltransferase
MNKIIDMKLIFLKPNNLKFILRIFIENLIDKILNRPEISSSVKNYVFKHAKQNNPDSVLKAMDNFAKNKRFLMNIGNEKGLLLTSELKKLGSDISILELGCFCGYSAILMAKNLNELGKVVSLEVNKTYAKNALEIIKYAGLKDKIIIIEGSSEKIIGTLRYRFDFVLLDHWKNLYKRDLILIEKRGLLKSGSVIFADNVGRLISALVGSRGDSNDYLSYVRKNKNYTNANIKTYLEYSKAEDEIEISTYSLDY